MLGWKLLSDLILPKIVASALRSEIFVCSWSWARTYCSLGVQPGHFHDFLTTSIATGLAAQAAFAVVSNASPNKCLIIIKVIFSIVPAKDVAIIVSRSAFCQALCQDIVQEELASLFKVTFSYSFVEG